ncbi:MAG: sulfoxide reductase heme-binding subunit YedZ [Gammaproteobacteria bacterium]|nr:sulfoxide reductase heme-binding subunit YedZ [Gammaproteobacteria bacterium]
MTIRQKEILLKASVFIAASLPLALLLSQVFEVGSMRLGPNPVEDIQDATGIWGIRLLAVTLSITPLSWVTGPLIIRVRRMLGLFAFTYCSLHFLNYLLLDQTLNLAEIFEDILERPFITIGFAALLTMLPLAITSTNNWRRKLGRRWNTLHKLMYLICILGCWHFYWQVKKDLTEPLIYCAIIGLLLTARIIRKRSQNAKAAARKIATETTDSRSTSEC